MMKNILVLGTYAVDYPYGGGKYVGFHLFNRLSNELNIKYFSSIESDKIPKELSISPRFVNIHIPQNIEQAKIQWKLEEKEKQTLSDVIQINYWQENLKFIDAVQKILSKHDLIILEHPYFSNFIHSLDTTIPIIYHALDFEYGQKKSILSPSSLTQVKQAEELACKISTQIWTSSEDEKNTLKKFYDVTEDKIKILPHGIDLSKNLFIGTKERSKTKIQVGFSSKTTLVFTGSWHPPNLEALEFIIFELAPLGDDFQFLIVGGVKDQFLAKHPGKKTPENVKLLGNLSDSEKFEVYKMSDFAINPMFSGAGTNLKILEYMAVGLPIISTKFGARGINLSKNTLICSKNEWISVLKDLKNSDYQYNSSIEENYKIILANYDYGIIAKKCLHYLNELNNFQDDRLDVYKNIPLELDKMNVQKGDPIIDVISAEIASIIK